MALKQIKLRAQKRALILERNKLREQYKALQKRQEEADEAIEEAADETSLQAVQDEIDAIKAELDALGLPQALTDLDARVTELESQIDGLDDKTEDAADMEEEARAKQRKTRGVHTMGAVNTRAGWAAMSRQERTLFVEREQVKSFIVRMRMMAQKRASDVSGAELLIPVEVLDLLRMEIDKYSKLIGLVRLKPVSGVARQNVLADVPEAIWTEACGALNRMKLDFSQAEVDGYKVGGIIGIANSLLEDSNPVDLMSEVLSALGQSLGYAIDKAIPYGTGSKMPLGFVTRLAQTEAPANYPAKARAWEDLHTKNLIKLDPTGKKAPEFFGELLVASAAAKSKYGSGGKFVLCNELTRARLQQMLLTFNASGALVAALNDEMPVIGGKVVELDFIPDGDLLIGYGAQYLLAERAGTALDRSEHAEFVEDNTLFRGRARYDGMPIIAEGFAAINIDNKDVTTSVAFASDTAN